MKNQNERGILTPTVTKQALEFLGEEITQTELRLYPYLDYCWKNGGYIDRRKMSIEEYDIITSREEQGHLLREIDDRMSEVVKPTPAFYLFVQKILLEAYVMTYEPQDGEN